MINWSHTPMVRVLIPLIAGIFLADIYGMCISLELCLAVLGCSAVGLYFLQRTGFVSNYLLNLSGLFVLLFLFSIGFSRYKICDKQYNRSHFSHYVDSISTYYGIIEETPKYRNRAKTLVSVRKGFKEDSELVIEGKLLLYFPKEDSSALKLRPGDKIAFQGRAVKSSGSRNPKTFDYDSYLKYRHTTHLVYLRNVENYSVLSSGNLVWWRQSALDLRERCLNTLAKHLKDKDQLAISSAMILGYKNHIDQELYNSFTDSGSVHVLAVSGLHVGVICGILMFFFNKWRSSSKRVKIFKWSLIGLVVLFYAMLTGAAPAVIRASIMFMFILLGRFFFSHYNIFNILALTAVLMLMYDPYYLFQASFQFSFLALTSLIVFLPPIMTYIPIAYEWMIKPTELLMVSVAAQLLVFPITVFFFHKFPVYFALSGILAVPLAILTLKSGLLMLMLGSIPLIGGAFVGLHKGLIFLLIQSIELVKILPMYSWNNLWLSATEVVIIYGAYILFMVYMSTDNDKHLYLGVIALFLLPISRSNWTLEQKKQLSMAMYDTYDGTLIDFFDGRHVYTYKREESSKPVDENFVCNNYRYFNGMKGHHLLDLRDKAEGVRLYQYDNIIRAGIHDILIAENDNTSQEKIDFADIIVLQNDYMRIGDNIDMDRKLLLCDRSCSRGQVNYWKEFCKSRKCRFYSVVENGALLFDLNQIQLKISDEGA